MLKKNYDSSIVSIFLSLDYWKCKIIFISISIFVFIFISIYEHHRFQNVNLFGPLWSIYTTHHIKFITKYHSGFQAELGKRFVCTNMSSFKAGDLHLNRKWFFFLIHPKSTATPQRPSRASPMHTLKHVGPHASSPIYLEPKQKRNPTPIYHSAQCMS